MESLSKKDLVKSIALELDISQKDAKNCLETVLKAIEKGVIEKGKVTILGFGSFEKKDFVAKVPKKIGDKKAGLKKIKTTVIKFKPGESFKRKK